MSKGGERNHMLKENFLQFGTICQSKGDDPVPKIDNLLVNSGLISENLKF